MAHADYQAPNGKLIRVFLEEENGRIKNIRITGDFFIYPEESIVEIERAIEGRKAGEIAEAVSRLADEKGIRMIGLSPEDLQNAAERALKGI